jgi:acetyl esterase/lipase
MRARCRALFAEGFFLTRDQIDFFERCFTGDVADDPDDDRAHPIVGELAGLPSALVVTGGFDPLRDGGEAYAANAARARSAISLAFARSAARLARTAPGRRIPCVIDQPTMISGRPMMAPSRRANSAGSSSVCRR